MSNSVTAKALIEALRRHHEPPPSKPAGGWFVTETQAPNSTRRADALYVAVNSAQRGQLIGYETKVTRADVVAELRDPMKADAWEKYCHRWWLVIPHESLVDGLEIPERWGIMTPPASATRRSMRIVRRAPELPAIGDRAEALATLFAKLFYGGEGAQQRVTALTNQQEWQQNRIRELDAEIRQLRALADVSDARSARVRVVDVLTAIDQLERETGAWLRSPVSPTLIAQAIVTASETADVQNQIAEALAGAQRQLGYAQTTINKLAANATPETTA